MFGIPGQPAPPPWIILRQGYEIEIGSTGAMIDQQVCRISNSSNAEANARLIEASWDMLKLCQEIVEGYDTEAEVLLLDADVLHEKAARILNRVGI